MKCINRYYGARVHLLGGGKGAGGSSTLLGGEKGAGGSNTLLSRTVLALHRNLPEPMCVLPAEKLPVDSAAE